MRYASPNPTLAGSPAALCVWMALVTLRNARPVIWRPRGCTDALDGSNSFNGAMRVLSNVVPNPSTQDQWVPRPARDYLTNFNNAGFDQASTVANFVVAGDTLYGLVASAREPGRDEPFAVDLVSGQTYAVAGITFDNTPLTRPPQGATQIPILTKVGSRIVVTHPGFPRGVFNPDTSFTITGNTQTGFAISGTGIQAGSIVLSTASVDFNTTATGTAGDNFFTVADPTQIRIGQLVAGPGAMGFVSNISGTTITITIPLTQNLAGQIVSFHGDAITMNLPAVASINGETITIQSSGDRSVRFGWFDISSANIPISANTMSGSAVITAANTLGLQPGLLAAGSGIPTNTTLVDITNPVIVVAGNPNNPGDTILTLYYGVLVGDNPPFTFPFNGQTVTGPGVDAPVPLTVAGDPVVIWQTPTQAVVQVTLSSPALGSGVITSPTYTFSGLYEITLSAAATATAMGVTVTFTGGTPTAPLWGAGDTAINHLPSTPVGVGSFNGRAYFACGDDGVPFSDSGFPCLRTNANQAIVFGNGLAATACVGQPLNTPITGGVVQALYVFQGDSAVQQITGDQTTNNLAVNALNI